jgi:GT2 family glycosyltransferase
MADPQRGSAVDATELLIVIVCYRATELTIECLKSLEAEVDSVSGTRVAVCENGTGGNSAARIAAVIQEAGWQGWATVTTTLPNRGFAGGNNVILRQAMAWTPPPKYFLLLNADTLVRPNALRLLVEAMEARPDVGIVTPCLEAEDGKAQVSCFRFHSPASEFLRAACTGPITKLLKRFEVPMPPSDQSAEPDWASFACALIRREVLEEIGLLDERFFLYFDDPDLCRRGRKIGWSVLYCPEARVLHLVGRSNPVESLTAQRRRRPRFYYASRTRYFAKHYGSVGPCFANVMWIIGRSISLVRELLGKRVRQTCDKEWLDIWTNTFWPLTGRSHGPYCDDASRIGRTGLDRPASSGVPEHR